MAYNGIYACVHRIPRVPTESRKERTPRSQTVAFVAEGVRQARLIAPLLWQTTMWLQPLGVRSMLVHGPPQGREVARRAKSRRSPLKNLLTPARRAYGCRKWDDRCNRGECRRSCGGGLAQVLPLFGAGVISARRPAPQNEHLRALVAQVPHLKPHLRQQPMTPAPTPNCGFSKEMRIFVQINCILLCVNSFHCFCPSSWRR